MPVSKRSRPKPKPQPAAPPAPTITAGEVRIELQLEGVRSILSSGFLALGESARRIENALERVVNAIEEQTKLLTRSNGHVAQGARPSID